MPRILLTLLFLLPSLSRAAAVPIVELSGDPATLGTQYATKLSPPIHDLFDHYLKPHFKTETEHFLACTLATMFESHLSEEYRAEIHALAAGTHLPEPDVMLAQCFLDLTPDTACSTITLSASASPDHTPRFGRNLDFPGHHVLDHQSVLVVYHPKDHHSFASITYPGLIGVLSGINDQGLSLANMELPRSQRLPAAMPYTLLYRSILENCKTVNEAIAYLQKTPRQSANNLMLMDATGDRAVIEISPDSVVVRRAPDGAPLISTNHTRGPTDLDTPNLCPRYDALNNNAKKSFGSITPAILESLLTTASQGNFTLQSMIFEPTTLTLYLSTGPHADTGPYDKIDLNHYLTPH